MTTLTNISPIDGRYSVQTQSLSPYFSEFALMRYRVLVEVEYFIALCELGLPQLQSFDKNHFHTLRQFYKNFSISEAEKIKQIEKITNHDVKAVEYFIKDFFVRNEWQEYCEFIHFGLTSQDINNTAIPLSLKEALNNEILPHLQKIQQTIEQKGREWLNIPMLARTHGQPATPTTMGKEWLIFAERLTQQLKLLTQIPFSAKFGGATGSMNAHFVAFPDVDWHTFASNFLSSLGLQRSYPTTQIEHYDHLAAHMDNLKRINTILIDFARDMWLYIAMDYFKQNIQAHEVGSSAMPHKINPIDFENAEGNLGYANAIFEYLSAKLPTSRLQRDLTDSTVLRNLGVPIAHSYIAFKSILKGISKLQLNTIALQTDLEQHWEVIAEAIQTILRREKYPQAYEILKQLTRKNEKITQQTLNEFIETLNINENVKQELKAITPFNYIGKF